MLVSAERDVTQAEVVALYDSVGWSAYTRDPAGLLRAIAGSHLVLTARDDRRLVGLARTVSDGQSICYVQDLLVHGDFQRRGVGRALFTEVLAAYRHCRQFILTTDAEAKSAHAFYRSFGLTPHEEQGLLAFTRP